MRNVEDRRANHRVTVNTKKNTEKRDKMQPKCKEKKRSRLFRFVIFFFSVFFSVFSVTLWLALLPVGAQAPSPPPAPVPPSSEPENTYRAPSDRDVFAVFMLQAVNLVGETYVRPVARTDLLETALTALYERARRPVPRDLRRRIERAEKEASAHATPGADPPQLVPGLPQRRLSIGDDGPLLALLRVIRADLGKAESLGGDDPLCIGCQAMLRALDPYSGMVTTKEDGRSLLGSEREGFGLEVPEEGERIIVTGVLPGSPAQEAGLRRGDEIIRLQDSDGRNRNLKESLSLLNGRAPLLKPQLGALALPEPITITYRRPPHPHPLSPAGRREPSSPPSPRWGEGVGVRGGVCRVSLEWRRYRAESVFGVTRREDNSWNYWLDAERKIAYLRLGSLTGSSAEVGTPEEMSDILSVLREDGLRGLILDLRWCPGGSLPGSTRTAELFLGEGTIATVRYRNRPEEVFRSTNENKHNDFPMVVLINSDSTGGAELIAAALQDHHRAVLVGQRTHGKGNVQALPPLGAVGLLKITSGTIARPSGKPLHRFPDSKPEDPWGVHPDPGHEFRLSAEASRALRTWCEEQTMRPGSSTKRLPLDDSLADPQRNAALETLVELMNRKDHAKAE
jgi:carboxyl-terminal processing protease